jgi:hypothetical protein
MNDTFEQVVERRPFGWRDAAARLWPLLVLLALALFPFGWLAELWPIFNTALGRLFPTATEHAVGHTTLFFCLGLLALTVIPALRARPWGYLALILLVGMGQESFQLLYKQRPFVFDDARDLVTDLFGALVAFALVWLWQRRHRPR